jgi:hypothetical protein
LGAPSWERHGLELFVFERASFGCGKAPYDG